MKFASLRRNRHSRSRAARNQRKRGVLNVERLEDRVLLSLSAGVGAGEFVPGEVLIGFEGEIPAAFRTQGATTAIEMAESRFSDVALTAGKALQHRPAGAGRPEQLSTLWTLAPGTDVLEAIRLLSEQPGVAYAEPN